MEEFGISNEMVYLFNRGKYRQLVALISDITKKTKDLPPLVLSNLLLVRGTAYLRMGDVRQSQAKHDFILAVKSGHRSHLLFNNLGAILYNQRKFDRALEHFRIAGRLTKKPGDMTLRLRTNNKYEKCIILNNRACAYYRLGMTRRSISDLNRAIDEERDNYIYLNNLGRVYELSGKLNKAHKYYARAVKILSQFDSEENDIPGVYDFDLGRAYHKLEEYENAHREFSIAIEHCPTDKKLYFFRAINRTKLGQYKEAIADLEFCKIMVEDEYAKKRHGDEKWMEELTGKKLNVMNHHLSVMIEQEMYDPASESAAKTERLTAMDRQFEAIARLDVRGVNTFNYRLLRGHYYFNAVGDYEKAISEYKTAMKHIDAADDSTLAGGKLRYYRGIALTKLGKLELASQEFNLAVKMGYKSPKVINAIGIIRYLQGNYENAVKILRGLYDKKIFSAKYQNSKISVMVLALAYFKLGEWGKSIRILKSYLSADNDDVMNVVNIVSTILVLKNELSKAKIVIETLESSEISQSSDTLNSWLVGGNLLTATGKFKKGIKAYSKISKESGLAVLLKGYAYHKLKRYKKAAREILLYLQIDPNTLPVVRQCFRYWKDSEKIIEAMKKL